MCPHAVIRPVLLNEEEMAAAPAGLTAKDAVGAKGLKFRIAVSAMDCVGCGNCVQVCPAKEKALIMKPLATQMDQVALWDYVSNKVAHKANPMNKKTVKGVQFEEPLLEFSGACAGCGETPYAKLVTQLVGDRMMIANATGCTSIWGASAPSMPYTKNCKGHGLTTKTFSVAPRTIEHIIRDYTREAGVRNLERKIAALCRKAAKQIVDGDVKSVKVNPANLTTFLGPIVYLESDLKARSEVGICTGLAWTSVGGEMLKVEVIACAGKGKLQLTGQLGDVMKESAQAGYTYIRSRAKQLGLQENFSETTDIHIHLPEGAIPKDGPSAGITMVIAMESALTKRKVKAGIAMTGEITLSGRVLPGGGIKEKMLAASRYGIKKILLPAQNMQDLDELPKKVRDAIEFIPVEHMDQVTKIALED